MDLDITIIIDRDLDIKVTKQVRQGQPVGSLRALLAADDPTGQASAESIVLAQARPEGEAGNTPLRALRDYEPLTADLGILEICSPEDVEPAAAAPATPVAPAESAAPAAPATPATPSKPSAAAKTQDIGSVLFAAKRTAAPGRSATTADRPDQVAKQQAAKLPAAEVQKLLERAHAALAAGADFDAANASLGALTKAVRTDSASRPRLLLARGLLFWRWSKFDRALRDLMDARRMGAEGSSPALLALRMCLRQWPEASELAQAHSKEAAEIIEQWLAGLREMTGVWSPSPAEFVPRPVEVMPSIRQLDARVKVDEEVELGARFFLQLQAGTPSLNKPMLLYFHGNAETVDTYKDPAAFKPIQDSGASALIVDFRGYGFSSGAPSFVTMHTDARRFCDELPSLFKQKGLPWPWPGRLFLLGRSLGSIIACHLAAVRADVFSGGIILESAICGSHAPGAEPPPEPPSDGSPMGGSGKKFQSNEAQVAEFGRICQELAAQALGTGKGRAPALEHFVHLFGNEDLIRGYDGRLLILHGAIDTIIPKGHAQRLCDAAEASMRKLVIIGSSGHNDLSYTEKYCQAMKTFLTAK
mmetsp:Transcript_41958/g.75126  ORF Transcript_41958/g.75126 Transcript_41958/m.75126 type:complete len:588 (+) Transcript_41958:149-1912(+)